jgi:hypothetical protein
MRSRKRAQIRVIVARVIQGWGTFSVLTPSKVNLSQCLIKECTVKTWSGDVAPLLILVSGQLHDLAPLPQVNRLWYPVGYSDWPRAGRRRGWSSSPGKVKNFHFSTASSPVVGPTQIFIQRAPRSLASGVKRPGCEADHSPPASAEVKKMWIYTSTPQYVFMA